jgi:capsular polysaccharide biosynthesis protein
VQTIEVTMDFWKTVLVLLRRWTIAVPVFVCALAAAGAMYVLTPLQYQTVASVVLTIPANGPTSESQKVTGGTNPLLAFDSGLAVSASIVSQSLATSDAQKELGSDGKSYLAEVTGGANGPFISVKTTAPTAKASTDLAKRVLDRVRLELVNRQQALQAPATTFIRVEDVVPPTDPQVQRGGKLRAGGVALVLAFGMTLFGAYGYESFHQARSRRKKATARRAVAQAGGSPAERHAGMLPDPATSAEPTRRLMPAEGPGRQRPSLPPVNGNRTPEQAGSGTRPAGT